MKGLGTVAVVGLGLIGGSLARDLAARGVRVLAHDRDGGTLRDAGAAGAIAGELGAELDRVAEADVLVVATPVSETAGVLERARPRLDRLRLITDVGSTKVAVADAARRLGVADRFVGSHPFAGSERSGWAASRAGLFTDTRVFLCPAAGVSPDALRLARELWDTVGAQTEEITAEEHDRLLAWTSHLPQVVATALAGAFADAGIPRAELGPGGRVATRLAASSAAMWTAIAATNGENLSDAVAGLERRLAALRAALRDGDWAEVSRFFEVGRRWTEDQPGPAS